MRRTSSEKRGVRGTSTSHGRPALRLVGRPALRQKKTRQARGGRLSGALRATRYAVAVDAGALEVFGVFAFASCSRSSAIAFFSRSRRAVLATLR